MVECLPSMHKTLLLSLSHLKRAKPKTKTNNKNNKSKFKVCFYRETEIGATRGNAAFININAII